MFGDMRGPIASGWSLPVHGSSPGEALRVGSPIRDCLATAGDRSFVDDLPLVPRVLLRLPFVS